MPITEEIDGEDQAEQDGDAEAVDQPRHHVAALVVGAEPVAFEIAAASSRRCARRSAGIVRP
jgi:hypothetical protein